MSTAFDAMMLADATGPLMADFGESLIYRKADGTDRAIKGLVNRLPPEAVGGPQYPNLELRTPNRSDGGISSAEVDAGGDRVWLPARLGLAERFYQVILPRDGQPTHDPGMCRLLLK